jgi:tetratricopeptide (TPR) repeat protein
MAPFHCESALPASKRCMAPVKWIVSLLLVTLPAFASYEQAVTAFQSGRFAEVLALISSLSPDEAQRPAAQNLRSLALMNMQRYDEALGANQAARKLDPANVNYIYNAGLIVLTKGDLPGAERVYREAVREMPRSSRLYEGLGETLFKMSQYPEAEATFRRALDLDASNLGAQVALAKLLYAVGDRTNFEAAILKAIRMGPDNYLACYYYGKYLEQKGQADEACGYYEKSCQLAPGFFDGLIAWGEILSRQGHLREAAAVYERARASRPDDAQVYFLLSQVWRKLGDTERAQWAIDEFRAHAKP